MFSILFLLSCSEFINNNIHKALDDHDAERDRLKVVVDDFISSGSDDLGSLNAELTGNIDLGNLSDDDLALILAMYNYLCSSSYILENDDLISEIYTSSILVADVLIQNKIQNVDSMNIFLNRHIKERYKCEFSLFVYDIICCLRDQYSDDLNNELFISIIIKTIILIDLDTFMQLIEIALFISDFEIFNTLIDMLNIDDEIFSDNYKAELFNIALMKKSFIVAWSILSECNLDINNNSFLYLHFAVMRGDIESCQFLISNGINVNIKDLFNNEAIDYALEGSDIYNLLNFARNNE